MLARQPHAAYDLQTEVEVNLTAEDVRVMRAELEIMRDV